MELLCPNCQKKLTIPEHFAGQMAKCPMCSHTFTAPELPAPPGAFVPAPPVPTPVVSPPIVITPPPALFDRAAASTPATPPPGSLAPDITPASGIPLPAAAPPSVAPAPAGDYSHRGSMHLDARFLQGATVAAVLLLFVLSFFPWVGRYPGGVPLVTQSAWQAAFGSESVDSDRDKVKLPSNLRPPPGLKTEAGAGVSGMMIAYVLLLIPTLLLTLAATLWQVLPLKLPAGLERLRPWRWGMVAAVALLALVLLAVQEISAFPLEERVTEETNKALESKQKKASAADAPPAFVKSVSMERGLRLSELHRTAALSWATGLNLLAVVGALLVFWVERRGNRPLPRVDVLW